MKDAGVVEEDKVSGLQPVDYESPRILQQLGKLTVSGVKLFEPRALERQRRDRVLVVINGAKFLNVSTSIMVRSAARSALAS